MNEKLRTLQELLEYQLKDLHSAEALTIEVFPMLISKVRSEELKKILEIHLEETKGQKYRLEKAADALGINPAGERCNPMEGYVKELKKLLAKEKNQNNLERGLADVAIKIEQYEIYEYMTAHQYARRLGLHSLAELLAETLEQEKNADKQLKQFTGERQEAEALNY